MSSDTKTFELLGEIANLLKKYGKPTFLELATFLRDPALLDQVANALEEIAKKSPQKKKLTKRPSAIEERARFRESLIALGKSDPGKSNLLVSLFDSLQDKSILPSYRELADFVSDQGLPVPKAKSRGKVIISFLKSCIDLPLNNLKGFKLTESLQNNYEDTDRSLEGWGKVILDRKGKNEIVKKKS